MAMLEAMAYGLPVITTPVGGIPDLVSDRAQGLMVAPGNVEQIAAALRLLIEDESLRLKLGRCARERAQECDVTQYSTQLTSIYRRLLAAQKWFIRGSAALWSVQSSCSRRGSSVCR